MVQIAVRLAALTLRLVAKILPTENHSQDEAPCKDEEEKLLEIIQRELGQAIPYYEWQGPRNHFGRARYLMILLEEAFRLLAVPTTLFVEALKQDPPAAHASKYLAEAIRDLGQTNADLCGAWAADILLSVLPPKSSPESTGDRKPKPKLAGSDGNTDLRSEEETSHIAVVIPKLMKSSRAAEVVPKGREVLGSRKGRLRRRGLSDCKC